MEFEPLSLELGIAQALRRYTSIPSVHEVIDFVFLPLLVLVEIDLRNHTTRGKYISASVFDQRVIHGGDDALYDGPDVLIVANVIEIVVYVLDRTKGYCCEILEVLLIIVGRGVE